MTLSVAENVLIIINCQSTVSVNYDKITVNERVYAYYIFCVRVFKLNVFFFFLVCLSLRLFQTI